MFSLSPFFLSGDQPETYGLDAGKRCDCFENLLMQRGNLLFDVAGEQRVDVERDQVRGVDSRIHVSQILHRAHKQAGADAVNTAEPRHEAERRCSSMEHPVRLRTLVYCLFSNQL
jgi:hypothetical protein